ncbi:hypothetical protein [Marinobacterium sp. BA1]|uniref:hypothetical protein n=1 Tax=Marinobacterium sp. BA1 TaxID=3138931 RepID=UPI0032E75682
MENKVHSAKYRNTIRSIKDLLEKDYVVLNDKSIGKIVNDFYFILYNDIYELRNTDRLTNLIPIIESLNEKEKQAINSYIMMLFPVQKKDNQFRFKKANKFKLKLKNKLDKEFTNMQEKFRPEKIIDYPSYKIIYSEFSDVKSNQIDSLIELFGSIDQVVKLLRKSLKWPNTDIAISIQSIFKTGWISTGLLSSEGYHVGNIGLDSESRKLVLKDIIFKEFSEENNFMDEGYINAWSNPGTLPRLLKLARTIAALCRNAKRSSHDYTNAINDWESDLAYLKTEFYEPWIQKEAIGQAIEQLKWPETAV